MWNLERNDSSELTYKTERLTEVEKGLMVARGKRQGEGLVEEFGTDMYTHLYLKGQPARTSCSTGDSAQCYVAAWMGGELGGEWTQVHS